MHRLRKLLAAISIALSVTAARADIYQWEYINPVLRFEKQQSIALCPDGAAVDAVPGADLSSRNLTMAYLIDKDLTSTYWKGANLTDAALDYADSAQLYSTASYKDRDLSGIYIENRNPRRR